MVINRSMHQAQVLMLGEDDEYGQPQIVEAPLPSITLSFGLYTHSSVEDPRYQDVEYTGLTTHEVNDKMVLQIGDERYKVLFVNPFGRINQVFLKSI